MGGMFTVLKVRDDPDTADPAAWYTHPKGSVAGPADPARMRADGIGPEPVPATREGTNEESGERSKGRAKRPA
jgi:hypothetical protein